MMRTINTRAELVALAKELGVRQDWHEPDEQLITAELRGTAYDFDNAMGVAENYSNSDTPRMELHVVLRRLNDKFLPEQEIAAINLATLFAWATGYEARESRPSPEVQVLDRVNDVLLKFEAELYANKRDPEIARALAVAVGGARNRVQALRGEFR